MESSEVGIQISNRLGIVRGWDSNWFGGKDFGDNLVEDQKIRKYLNERLAKASVSKIVIERTLKLVTITICTARPGIVIGKGGQDVDKLKEELKKLYDKEIQINIFEVKRPELDATIVANNIARQVEGKIAYRRAIPCHQDGYPEHHACWCRGYQGSDLWSSERSRNRP